VLNVLSGRFDRNRASTPLAKPSPKAGSNCLATIIHWYGVMLLYSRSICCVSSALKDWIRDAEQFDDLTFVVMKVR
jgi:hypothetical protein